MKSDAERSNTTTWRQWCQRVARCKQAAQQELIELETDLALLRKRWQGGAVVRQKRIDGNQLVVFANEDVGRQIYFFRTYERDESAYIRGSIRATDTCVDIGANVGYYTLLFSRAAKCGTVHSFEPVPLNFQILTTNVMLNNASNTVLNPWAIGSAETEVDFVLAVDGAFSSLVDTGRKPARDHIRVHMTTLDQYCENKHVSRIDLLKVDVEGAELQVVEGATHLLRYSPPRLIMLELYEPMLNALGSGITRVLERMRDFGYAPHICCGGEIKPFAKEHYNRYQNVFFSKEK